MDETVLAFGRWRLLPASRRLYAGQEPIPLGSRAFDLLLALVEARGALVTKEALLQRIWPGTVVEENNLAVQASALRKALGEDAAQFIATIQGRGYRFTGTIREEGAGPAAGTTPAAAPAVPARRPGLVVLPFTNMTADPEQEYFADGITEDLTTALSHTTWLSVIARNSAFTYKGRATDVREVGRELGVGYVLEGSVRRAGGRVRITAQLCEAASGEHLWAERIDGQLDDIFDLQDRVTTAVARAIEPRLLQAEMQRARQRPTGTVAAYDAYLRALAQTHRQSNEGSVEALAQLDAAMRIEPDAALLWAMAAYCHAQRRYQGWTDPPGDPAEGMRLALGGIERGPDDPEVLWRCGVAMMHCGGTVDQCFPLVERAIAAIPNSSQALLHTGWVRVYAGENAKAIQAFEDGIRLSPLDPHAPLFMTGLCAALLFSGDADGALRWGRESLARNPLFFTTHRLVAVAHALRGEMAEARAVVAQLMAQNPGLRIAHSRQSAFRFIPNLDMYLDGLRAAGLPE